MKKSFVIGLATGLTVAGASLVLANSQIQAILNDQIKVTLNGQVQEFKDETTNETQYPITYHDRTYLPLRTVANLVGVDVDYDADNNTALLSSNDNIVNLVYSQYQRKDVEIPYININSEDAKRINEEWKQKASKYDEDYNLGYFVMPTRYKYVITDKGILSLIIIQISDGSGVPLTNVYNFDINTGKLLQLTDILDSNVIEELRNKLGEICMNIFEEHWENYKDNIEVYNSYREEMKSLIPKDLNDIDYYNNNLIIKHMRSTGAIDGYIDYVISLDELNLYSWKGTINIW